MARFPEILYVTLRSYWPLILTTFVSRFSEFIRPERFSGKKDPFTKPYANVVRMHLLIFVFAGLHIVKIDRLAIYPVLAFYFVPWSGIMRRYKSNKQKSA
jgi:hypothetical protein